MKKLLFFLIVSASTFTYMASAQAPHFCATTEKQLEWFRQHPELEKKFFSQRAERKESLSNAKKQSSVTQYTIPVVFHILHKGYAGNISDAQVHDAIRILNRDFNKQNADTSELVTAFQGKAANVGITFALAKIDPFGMCTNGIKRYEMNTTLFTGDQTEYQFSWPREKYLNIYVVGSLPSGMNAAAYTYLPGSGIPEEMDAIVATSSYVGSVGSGTPLKSRVLTHEVGHWLGLEHVWGWNQVGTMCGDDYIGDTPETKGFTGCDSAHGSVCFPPIVENFQNYMDYSYCCRMFTQGQADWMTGIINWGVDYRDNLSMSWNLAGTGLINIENFCKTELKISPSSFVSACVGKTITLTTYTSFAPATSVNWYADNGAILLNPTSFTTGIVITNTGVSQVQCVAGNGAGNTSAFLTINGVQENARIKNAHHESFEALDLPQSWTSYCNAGDYWSVFKGASYDGYNSAVLKAESLEPGAFCALESPAYDLSDTGKTSFTFRYAYARASGSHQDVFKVQGSSDCGTTWTDIYTPYVGAFAAVSAGIKPDVFIPEYHHWRLVDLGSLNTFKSFKGQSNVRFRFWFREDTVGLQAGNRLYLDAINFATVVGLDQHSLDASFNIFPQPSQGKLFMRFESSGGDCSYSIESADGKLILQKNAGVLNGGQQELGLDLDVSPGLYLLRLTVGEQRMVTKIIVE